MIRDGCCLAVRLNVVCLGLVGAGCGAERQVAVSGVVPADWPAWAQSPIAVPLPRGPEAGNRVLAVMRVGDEPGEFVIPAQCEPADPISGTPARAWFLWPAFPSHGGKKVEVHFQECRPSDERANANERVYASRLDDPILHVRTADEKPILSFWHGLADRRNPKSFPLNDFIHPLIGLDGEVLTANSPRDHIHHRGIFWAWVRTELRGERIGGWWIPKEFVVDPGQLSMDDGPVFSRFASQHFWVHRPEGAAKGERFVEERVVCRVFKTGNEGRAVDVDLTLRALADGVRIGGQTYKDKGYGGLTIRFGEAADVKIQCDSQVIEEKNLNRLRARWVDWTGVFKGPDGKPLPHRSGGALFVHPAHPNLPPEWITRVYGPINVAYPGMDMLEIPKDKPLRLRYRIWIHRGDAAKAKVGEHYRAYAADWKWRNSQR